MSDICPKCEQAHDINGRCACPPAENSSELASATGYAPEDQVMYLTEQAQATANALLIDWVRERWTAEVKNRPLKNINRRTLDDTWRQVIRYAGGDPVEILGPAHDDLLLAHNDGTMPRR